MKMINKDLFVPLEREILQVQKKKKHYDDCRRCVD